MFLAWIGLLALVVVVVPVVVFLLYGVLKSALAVRRATDDIVEVGTAMVADLQPVPELLKTENMVGQTTAGLARYGAALDKIL